MLLAHTKSISNAFSLNRSVCIKSIVYYQTMVFKRLYLTNELPLVIHRILIMDITNGVSTKIIAKYQYAHGI